MPRTIQYTRTADHLRNKQKSGEPPYDTSPEEKFQNSSSGSRECAVGLINIRIGGRVCTCRCMCVLGGWRIVKQTSCKLCRKSCTVPRSDPRIQT